MPEISFFEQYEWDDDRHAMKFWADADGETLTCWIHASALSSAEDDKTDEPSETTQEYFMNHIEQVHTLARQLISKGELNASGEVFIDAAVLKRLGF